MLTETHLRALKPTEKPQKHFDSGGLFLYVTRGGSRVWRFKYRIAGREKLLSLGRYPDVPLKRARLRRDDARRLLADGIDPSAKKQAEKLASANTFEAVAREWLALHSPKWVVAHYEKVVARLERDLFPRIGSRPIHAITTPELLAVLKRIEGRTAETAHRVRSDCGRIFRFAIATGRAERDIAADLKDALAPVVTQNFPAITDPSRIGELLRAIDGYQGQPSTMYALKLAPLVFVRPGELRMAEWTEFDFDRAEWRLPAERMKAREAHLVPLSRQALEILKDLKLITGKSRLLFPSLRSMERPISENTLNAALRRLGYSQTEMTTHGFRSMASTCLNEHGWAPDVIELQLAHAERNQVRAAYNRASRLFERRNMMQAWADYLDGLRTGANVIPLRRSA